MKNAGFRLESVESHCGRVITSFRPTAVAGAACWVGQPLYYAAHYRSWLDCYKKVNGKKVYLGSCPSMHVPGSKSTYTYAKSLKVSKTSKTVKAGKTVSMPKVTTVKADAKKNLLPAKHVAKLRCYSSNTKVATVTAKGVIKGVGKGTCYVYATAQNGKTVKVKVTVK